MQYFYWTPHWTKGEVFIEEVSAPARFDDYYLGQPIAPAKSPLLFIYRLPVTRKQDLVSGIQVFPIVSRRLRGILEEFEPSDIEFHPVELRSGGKDVDKTYSIAHLLRPVDCMDRERSAYELDEEDPEIVMEIGSLVLDQDALSGRHIVRMNERPVDVLVSEELRAAMEQAGLTGMEFRPIL